jgi:hypothetical protein
MPSISPYAYCANNPVLLVDPDGRLPIIPWLLKAGAGAAADILAQASMDYLFNSNTTSWICVLCVNRFISRKERREDATCYLFADSAN